MTLCLHLPASASRRLRVDRYSLYDPAIWSAQLGRYWKENSALETRIYCYPSQERSVRRRTETRLVVGEA